MHVKPPPFSALYEVPSIPDCHLWPPTAKIKICE